MSLVKALGFLFWAVTGGCVCAASWIFLRWTFPHSHFRLLSRMAHWTARRTAKILGLRVRLCLESGTSFLPESVLVAANHRGYLDIVTLLHALPLRFVSKSELR